MNLKSLIAKLNDTCRSAMEGAAGLCVARTHYDIEIEHYLLRLLDDLDSDIALILKNYGVDRSRLTRELERSLDKLKTGNARSPTLSPQLVRMFTEAWTLATLDHEAGDIRSGSTLLALLTCNELSRTVRDISAELQLISAEALHSNFFNIVSSSREGTTNFGAVRLDSGPSSGVVAAGVQYRTTHLDQYTVNMTAAAVGGKIDTVLGRDVEIRQVVDILMRRRQNNPILTGEAGVGKTAIVEGLALRITAGDVPPSLRNVQLHSLDLALLQAGAGVKGEFENRLKGLIEEVKSSPHPVILFIDEAHTMIGAGGQVGQNDTANLLKPALARGELRTIAATTWSEYKKFFEKDAALARRFQVVKVEEPIELQCATMLRGLIPALEKHHGLRILDEAVTAAVRLSHRYMVGRQLPDKAVSVLDTACARLSLGQNTTPGVIEDTQRRIADLETQTRMLTREEIVGANHTERLCEIAETLLTEQNKLAVSSAQWRYEIALVEKIGTMRIALECANACTSPYDDSTAPLADEALCMPSREALAVAEHELAEIQGENPMLRVAVDAQLVGEVISAWTGIPLGKMVGDELSTVLELSSLLRNRVIGQDYAMDSISQRILTSRASLDDPGKPVGVFLLVGPSGVGKTETALALSDLLYGGERNVITINMSEFQEPHTVSTLKGSPPGYVGYGEGGILTEAVRRRPYSVVLLDEVEKAHPDVLELFFQVFDKGSMEDGEGRVINFKNTVIILTTNATTETIMKLTADPETMPFPETLVSVIKPELNKIFKPAFLGRMLIVPYLPIRDEALKQIIRLKLNKIIRRLRENHKVGLHYEDTIVAEIANRCTEVESGARNVDNILSNTMLPEISRELLLHMATGDTGSAVFLSVDRTGRFIYKWTTKRGITTEVDLSHPLET
ncbi:type VI secretion system ATPase TssH [Granulicella sp. L60]|uniref:type VI secretion system ATPase TssH n=1 Tax=Granulicella sp. L60 TaxID=1641866 RepID=UPI00131BA8CC|nr:type VI secretion system ATPase TssH [Granulicella sp. L60]